MSDINKTIQALMISKNDLCNNMSENDFNFVVSTLEHQIQKKPKKVNMQNVCAECGEHVKWCYSFCKCCGQAIDWDKDK